MNNSDIIYDVDGQNQGHPALSDEKNSANAPILLTIFPDRFASALHEIELPNLDRLARSFRGTAASNKDRLPWVKLAGFTGRRTPNGSLRSDATLDRLWGAEGDYDGELVPVEQAAAKIQASGIEALLYETASSSPERPRWRVIAPASREYAGPTDELRNLRAKWVARINGVLGGILAPESFVLSQAFYIGGVEGKPPITVITTAGEPIDFRPDLDAGAIFKNGTSNPTARTRPAVAFLDDDPIDSDDDPRLLRECQLRVIGFARRWGVGTSPAGDRAHRLVQWLADIGKRDGLTPSAEMIEEVIGEDYPDTTVDVIRSMLARRRDPRGWDVIDAELRRVRRGGEAAHA
jgi:hypothetical protein